MKECINPVVIISEEDKELQKSNYRSNEISPVYYADEIWTNINIDGVQPWYMISSYGRVYSKQNNHLLKQTFINSGYLKVSLRTINNSAADYLVHRLVALFYITNTNESYNQVNHINGIKYDNRLSNLEWVNQNLNMLHAYDIGLYARGEDHNFAVLSNDQVHAICKGLEDRLSYEDICNIIDMPYNEAMKANIVQIRLGNNWKHISEQYDIDEVGRNDQRFTDNEIHTICKCLEDNMSTRDILSYIGKDVSSYTSNEKRNIYEIVGRIRRRERFTRISDEYKF